MRIRHLGAGIAVILWTVIVVSAYYIVHRPWPPEQSPSLLLAIFDVLIAVLLTSLAGGVGQRIVGRVKLGAPLEQVALQLGMGVGILGLITLGFGLTGVLSKWMIWLSVFVGAIFLRKNIQLWLGHFVDIKVQYLQTDRFGKVLAVVVLLIVMMSLLLALAPPLKWDSLVYHLELPKEYLKEGRILYLEDNQFVGQPQLVEMNFTLAMAFHSGTTAATFGWLVGVIGLLGVGGFAGRLVGPRATFLAPMLLLTGESIAEGLSWAYVDLWLLLFGLGMIVALDNYTRSRSRETLLIAAVFAGFAASTKYTGAFLLIIGTILLILTSISDFRKARQQTVIPDNDDGVSLPWEKRSGFFRTQAQIVVIFGTIALLVLLPWLIKNFIFTGNPLYPFVFEGGAVDRLHQSFYIGSTPDRTILDDLTLPWDATILGVEDTPGYSSSIGPLMLVSIPFAILAIGLNGERSREDLFRLIVIAVFGWFYWATGSHLSHFLSSSRLYYGIFPALAVLGCAGIESLKGIKIPRIRIEVVVLALIFLSISSSLVSIAFRTVKRNPLQVIFGVQSSDDFLFQRLGWFLPAMNEINDLPASSKIAFLWESRAYYCENVCSPDVVIDRWWTLSRSVGNTHEIAKLMVQEGVSHVLVNNVGVDFVREQDNLFSIGDWQLLEDFIESELEVVEDVGGAYTLYSLNAHE